MAGPYDYMNRGIQPTQVRSESTENEMSRRQLPANPPVTILGDLIGRFDPSVGQSNALVDAIRRRLLMKMIETGSSAVDNYGSKQTYGQ